MKSNKIIFLTFKLLLFSFFLLQGTGCFSPDEQSSSTPQDQSLEQHATNEAEVHDEHDHDLHDHDEADHDDDHVEAVEHAEEHAHNEAEVHDEHDHDLHDHDEADHDDDHVKADEHAEEHAHNEAAAHDEHDHDLHHDESNHDDDHPGEHVHAEDEAHDDHDASVVKLSKDDMKRFGIEVRKVKAGEIAQHIRVPGEIVINSDRLAHIVPRVPGIVQQVKKNLGDFVKKEEVMAVVESRELADVKAAYLTSIESYQLAEPYFKREERLWKKKISSEQEYLDAKKALAAATIEMNKAKYKLRALGFSLKYIENLPSEPAQLFTAYKITAPFNGTIIEKHIALGEVVNGDDDIFLVANLDTVWVDLRVPQKDASSIMKGQKVTISGKSDATKINGIIDYVHLLIDEQTRTKLARVILDNTSGQFLPGTFITATVQIEKGKTDVVVDKSVLQNIDDKACVFVQNEQGFEPRPVVIGRSNETCVEIIDGLESGEIIVTENTFRIKAQLEKAAAGEQTGHGHSH